MSIFVKRLPKWLDIKVPKMQCDEHCGGCCGPVACSETEADLIRQFCEDNGVVLQNGDPLTCGFYQKGRCAIYPVRPFLCRLFGHVPGMVCVHGYNRNITKEKERKLMSRYLQKTAKQATKMINEIEMKDS